MMLTITRDSNNKVDAYFNDGAAVRRFGDTAQAGTFTLNLLGDDNSGNKWLGAIDSYLLFSSALTSTHKSNLYNNFGDPTLEIGKVCCRVWLTLSAFSFGEVEEGEISANDVLGSAIGLIIAFFSITLALVFYVSKRKD